MTWERWLGLVHLLLRLKQEDLKVQSQPGLQGEFKDSLSNQLRTYLKRKKKRKRKRRKERTKWSRGMLPCYSMVGHVCEVSHPVLRGERRGEKDCKSSVALDEGKIKVDEEH